MSACLTKFFVCARAAESHSYTFLSMKQNVLC